MAIETDFTIDLTNKRVYHSSGTTVYSVNALYTFLMDTFDEEVYASEPVPMSAQTPTEYSWINGWFMDDASHQYLYGGAIKTVGLSGEVQVITLIASGYTSAIAGDIGKVVTDDGGNTGALLAYDNTLRKWWVRWDTTVASSSVMAIASGTGAGTSVASGSVSGEDLFSNVYTLGTIASDPYPQIYAYQNGARIAEWSTLSNWNPGHIDVLLKVKEAGTLIDSGLVTIAARQAGDSFSTYAVDLSGGGRNAVSLTTATDLGEATGEHYLLYDAQSTTFVVNERINGATSGATAEVVADSDAGTTGVLTLRNVRGTFADNENLRSGATVRAVANGTVGDTLLTYDAQSANFTTIGQVLTGGTSGAKRLLRGQQDNGTSGFLVGQVSPSVTGTGRDAYYKAFVNDDVVTGASEGSCTLSAVSTTLVSGWSDITVAFVNGTATHGSITGTFIPGERITYTGGDGIFLLEAAGTATLGNMALTAINGLVLTGDLSGATMTASQNLQTAHTVVRAFEQQSTYPYDVIVECGEIYNAGRTLAQVYEYLKYLTHDGQLFPFFTVVAGVITQVKGEDYDQAYAGYAPLGTAPFGTFAGGVLFGARGVWFQGMASGQTYQVIDSDGTMRAPYASVTISVSGVVSGDRVSVFRTSGGVVDEAILSSHATSNDAGDGVFDVTAAIPTDTPASGTLRVVDGGTKQRYRYSSWSGTAFTLAAAPSGTADAGSTSTVLEDAASDFVTNARVGDVIRNVTDGSSGVITAIGDATHVTAVLTGGSDNSWQTGDTYAINVLDRNYDGSATAYAPFIDETAAATSVSKTVLYSSARDVVVRVRKKGILPFEVSGSVSSSGLSVVASRITDSIVS
jgi:hypothetical protein